MQDLWTFILTIKRWDCISTYHITPYNVFLSLTNQRPCHVVESTIKKPSKSFFSGSLTRTSYDAKPKQQQYCTTTKTNIHLLATLVSLKYTHLQLGWFSNLHWRLPIQSNDPHVLTRCVHHPLGGTTITTGHNLTLKSLFTTPRFMAPFLKHNPDWFDNK